MRGSDVGSMGGIRSLRFLGEAPLEVGSIDITEHAMFPHADARRSRLRTIEPPPPYALLFVSALIRVNVTLVVECDMRGRQVRVRRRNDQAVVCP